MNGLLRGLGGGGGGVKTKENFKLLALKVVAGAYERWSLTRCFKYRNLTWKPLVFRKLVAEERCMVATGDRLHHSNIPQYLLT